MPTCSLSCLKLGVPAPGPRTPSHASPPSARAPIELPGLLGHRAAAYQPVWRQRDKGTFSSTFLMFSLRSWSKPGLVSLEKCTYTEL